MPATCLTDAALTDTEAPKTHSPLYQHCDAAAGAAQRRWRYLFQWSLGVLAGISLLSEATNLGPLLLCYTTLIADAA